MIGKFEPPMMATRLPTLSRMIGLPAAICPPEGVLRLGWMKTSSAPAPFSVRSLVIVRAFVDGAPEPSVYVPGQTATVSPGLAASIAL